MPQISVNEHSSVRIQGAAGVVYVDPFHVAEKNADATVVCVTHTHFDHYDPESIQNIATAQTLFLAPADVAAELQKQGVEAARITVVEPGQSCAPAGIPVEVVAAYNVGKQFHPRENGWVGYVVTLDDQRVYVCGDTDNTPEARAVKADIVCVPVGGTYTTTAVEAAQLVAALNPLPQVAIPEHYGTVVGSAEDGAAFRDALASLVGDAVQVQLPY